MQRTFTYLGAGRNRITFRISKRYVVKIPLNKDGIADNYYEADTAKRDLHRAKCRLIGQCLVMEYVDDVWKIWEGLPVWQISHNRNNLPKWTYAIDCAQVGYTHTGKLVAYDYGIT